MKTFTALVATAGTKVVKWARYPLEFVTEAQTEAELSEVEIKAVKTEVKRLLRQVQGHRVRVWFGKRELFELRVP